MTYPGRGIGGQVVETIGARIVRGAYAPGQPLVPDELERDTGASRPVVREALRVLGAKGLIQSRQRRGTFVRPRQDWNLLDADVLRWEGEAQPTDAFLANLAEVRAIVEPAGARLAAARRTEADVALLLAAVDAMAEAHGDAGAVIEADIAFHRALLHAAHNEVLSGMAPVIEAGLRVRDRLVHEDPNWPDSVPVHRELARSVAEGEPERAVEVVAALLAQASTDADGRPPATWAQPSSRPAVAGADEE